MRGTDFTSRSSALAGFTLIEMVVALALVGLIALGLFESLRFGQRAYSKVTLQGGASWQIVAAQRWLRTTIESGYPQEPEIGSPAVFGLQGTHETLELTASAPLALGGAGLHRYRIEAQPNGSGGQNVVVIGRPDWASGMHGGPQAEIAEILIENIATMEWSYMTGGQWSDAWQGQVKLPQLVRLRVTFTESDSRRWPDLIVAPRITDDANCAFDVVAQRCRNAS